MKRRRNKLPTYIPDDNTLGGPTDRWMLPGQYPLGEGHTSIVKVLPDGNHCKCFKGQPLSRFPWMLYSEVMALKGMEGVHAPRYIHHDDTSITMSDAGVHLTAQNMPGDWDAQIWSILQTLKQARIKHNDIIPRNLMVKDDIITLIDFSMSTAIGKPYPSPWPNQRLLKIIQRDGDEVMLRRAINFILNKQEQWKEVQAAIANLGVRLVPGSNTRRGWMYHDVPFSIAQITHRKHTGERASAIRDAYNLEGMMGLDLGCSVGGMSFWLNRFDASMFGVERDAQSIRVANALKRYYDISGVIFANIRVDEALSQSNKYDFVVYLSTFMWVLKEQGLVGAKESLRRIGEITDTLFFETSHGDAMAGSAVIKAGLDNKNRMDALVMECTGFNNVKELFVDRAWNNRRLVMFTR